MNEQIFFTNAKGASVVFDEPYLLNDIEGIGGPDVDIQTQKAPFQHGVTVVDQLLDPREVTLTVTIFGSSRENLMALRRNLLWVLNPLLGQGVLTWRDEDDTQWYLDVHPKQCDFPGGEAAGPTAQTAIITFFAALPFWYQNATIGASQISGGLSFPIEFPIQLATLLGSSECLNEGDVETSVQFTVVGPCVNPTVENVTTGKKVKVTYTLALGEFIRVDTGFGRKEVVFIDDAGAETNIMNWITDDSEFWNLAVGSNQISYTEEGGFPTPMAFVSWRNHFTGR